MDKNLSVEEVPERLATATTLRHRRGPTSVLCMAINSANPSTAMTEIATVPVEINWANPPTATTTTEGVTAPAEIYSVNPCTDITKSSVINIPADIPLVNQPTGTESSQEELKRICKLAQPLAVAALSLTLLGLAPPSQSIKPNLIFPYNAFLEMVWLSIVISVGLTIYILVKRPPSQDFVWFHMRLMIIATASFLIAVWLWLFLKISLIIMLYDGLCFIAIVIAIIFYFWYSWTKANNSSQAAASSGTLLEEV